MIDILGFGAPLCYPQTYGRCLGGQDPGGAVVSMQFAVDGQRFKSHCGEVSESCIWPVQTELLGKHSSAYIQCCMCVRTQKYLMVGSESWSHALVFCIAVESDHWKKSIISHIFPKYFRPDYLYFRFQSLKIQLSIGWWCVKEMSLQWQEVTLKFHLFS